MPGEVKIERIQVVLEQKSEATVQQNVMFSDGVTETIMVDVRTRLDALLKLASPKKDP